MGYSVQPAGGSGGGDSNVLFRWNETDVSQFQIALDEIGGGTAALSVVSGIGPALRVTFPTKVTGQKATWITIPGVLSKNANDLYRYVLRFRVVGFSGNSTLAGEWYCVGPSFLCNSLVGASFYGLGVGAKAGTTGATRSAKVTAGVTALSTATPAWLNQVMFIPVNPTTRVNTEFQTIVIAKHANAAPSFNLDHRGVIAADQTVKVFAAADDTYFVNQVAAFSAGWSTETLDSCGFWILGNTGATANQYIEFADIEVLKHPMDLT